VKKILIVDDSPVVRHSLCTLFRERAEWHVCGEAENGREGIDKAQELSPDLVLMDLSMPVMNGFQAARELRLLMPKLPILMFTSSKTAQLETEALAVGITAVCFKSEGVETLVTSIRHLLKA